MIPIATTTITINRQIFDPKADRADPNPPYPETIVDGVRAVISAPSGSNKLSGGDRIVYSAQLTCDPCDLRQNDSVVEPDGTEWRCLWSRRQRGLGLDHQIAALRLVTGAT